MSVCRTDAPVYDFRTVNELLCLGYSEKHLTSIGSPPAALPGYITFFDPGWNINEIRRYAKDKARIFGFQTWYNDQPFAQMHEASRYRQLQMTAIPDSFGKIFAEQQALVPPEDEIPSARLVLTMIAIHFLASGERLFSNRSVYCANRTSDGSLVIVGGIGRFGTFVDHVEPEFLDRALGVAVSRKF